MISKIVQATMDMTCVLDSALFDGSFWPLVASVAITALAEVQQRVGGAPLSHLVVEARERNVIGLPYGAVFLDADFGHEKQRDALHAQRRIRSSSQYHMHNVLGNILLASRDPHLGTRQLVTAITNRLG